MIRIWTFRADCMAGGGALPVNYLMASPFARLRKPPSPDVAAGGVEIPADQIYLGVLAHSPSHRRHWLSMCGELGVGHRNMVCGVRQHFATRGVCDISLLWGGEFLAAQSPSHNQGAVRVLRVNDFSGYFYKNGFPNDPHAFVSFLAHPQVPFVADDRLVVETYAQNPSHISEHTQSLGPELRHQVNNILSIIDNSLTFISEEYGDMPQWFAIIKKRLPELISILRIYLHQTKDSSALPLIAMSEKLLDCDSFADLPEGLKSFEVSFDVIRSKIAALTGFKVGFDVYSATDLAA